MPDDRARRIQIGDHWLSRRRNSRHWCRTWFDAATRQTRRASLGTEDFREAQLRLAAWVTRDGQIRDQHPAKLPLATLFTRYWHNHAEKLPSADQARIALRYWTDFFRDAVVADVTPDRQDQFVDWLRLRGHSEGYISRILSVGRAAISRAHRRGELVAAPFIIDVETDEDRRSKEPKGRPLSVEEIARLLDQADTPHVFMFCLIACCTLARPAAILDLTVFQYDREAGILHLNPPGRRQTKKYRPTVPVARILAPWLEAAEAEYFVNYHGRPLKSIKTAFRRLRHVAGLDCKVNPYSFRHTVARELRRRGVPQEQRSAFLGHLPRGEARTSAIYAPDEPDFLKDAVEAIDGFMADVSRAATRPIVLSPTPVRVSCVPAALIGGRESLGNLVGAGGIEPPTPTMST
jgi:integrase